MINFDAMDFSERRPEEVISFFWRSVYIAIQAYINVRSLLYVNLAAALWISNLLQFRAKSKLQIFMSRWGKWSNIEAVWSVVYTKTIHCQNNEGSMKIMSNKHLKSFIAKRVKSILANSEIFEIWAAEIYRK